MRAKSFAPEQSLSTRNEMGGADETNSLRDWRPLPVFRILRCRRVRDLQRPGAELRHKWGAPHAACYAAFRLAACERTCKYVAPNGNVWPATRTEKKNEG